MLDRVCNSSCRVLEIGSWLGAGSTRVIIEKLTSLRNSRLYCVDTWKGSPNVPAHQTIVAEYNVFETFMHNIRQVGGNDIACPLVMDSQRAAEIIADGCFDLIFIDGDHSYASTRDDIRNWYPKVKRGGILCGHDCECRPRGPLRDRIVCSREVDYISGEGTPFSVIHPGVVLAVEEAFADSAHLWADKTLIRKEGSEGRASLWDVVL